MQCQELGFASEDDPSIKKVFQQKYRGSRYSFGYPACPNLEDRALVLQLLRPEEIGVRMSEGFMLVPEQTTDAIVAIIRRRNISTCDTARLNGVNR